jgi:hypothetical protein
MIIEKGETCSISEKNLSSIGQLASEGCISTFTDKAWKVTKGSLVIEKGEKVGTFYLCIGNVDYLISLASMRLDTTLWHHRLGHTSEKRMQILHKMKFLLDLKQIVLDFCEHCVYGKYKRVKFLRVRKEKKIKRLEVIHIGLWDQLNYHLLVSLVIILLLLMMQLEKLGFIAFDKNMMFLIFLINGNIWLRMRKEIG